MKFSRILSAFVIFVAVALIVLLSIFIPYFGFAFAGSVITVIVLLISISVSIAIYLYIDNHKKYMSDTVYRFFYFVILFIIGLAIRLACILSVIDTKEVNDFVSAFGRAIQTLYFTVAGIGFEGQDISFPQDASKIIPTIFYFGSMLWLAASYIIVIGAGVSYGVYSYFLKLLFCRFSLKPRSEYYIFTTVTEDAINLADSIRNKKGSKAFVIFAGNKLEKFDPSNELHQLIKQRKYPYLVLPNHKYVEEDTFRPTIGKKCGEIGITSESMYKSIIVGCGLLSKRRLKNSSFHIFAMEVNKDEKGYESANSDTIFDDIKGNLYDRKFFKKVVKKYMIQDEDNPYFHIDYYVLTNNSVNYEFYSKAFREIYSKYESYIKEAALKYKGSKKKLSKHDLDELKAIEDNLTNQKLTKLFKANIINEAYLSGISLIEERHKIELERIVESGVINKPTEKNQHVAIILGFGQTGQWALKNLYVDTCSVVKGKTDKDIGEQSRFIAHVYDEKIINYAGQFEKNHPSFLIAKVDENYDKDLLAFFKKNDVIDSANLDKLNKLIAEYKDKTKVNFVNKENLRKCYHGYSFSQIDRYMKFPHIFFHAKNCNSLSLLNDIDNVVGSVTKAPTAWKKADSIVIALGDDEDNIMTANAILQDIRQELYISYDPAKEKHNYLDIFVNIRDEKNRHRLNWNSKLEKEVHNNIRVVTFGSKDKMYDFDSIIDNLAITKLNSNYSLAGDNGDTFDFFKDKNKECTMGNIGAKYKESMQILDQLMVIEGFVKCISNSDFIKYKEEFLSAYIELGKFMYGKVSEKAFINNAFNRNYSAIESLVTKETYTDPRGKWKPKHDHLDNMEQHLTQFASEMTYADYVSIIVPFARMGLLKNTVTQNDPGDKGVYLLTLPQFKSFFPTSYDAISTRKMKEIGKNRKSIILYRESKNTLDGDMLFLDISRTLRSFYIDSYCTDSTRYQWKFLDYYYAYLCKKDDNGNLFVDDSAVLSFAERNYLAQLEHARWARYMFSRGTVYSAEITNPTKQSGFLDQTPICNNTNYDDKTYTKQFIKLHTDLVPYLVHKGKRPGSYLNIYSEIYDYVNALITPYFLNDDIKS